MENELRSAITRFRELTARYTHPPGRHGTQDERRQFHQAQAELWRLAQVICAELEPTAQRALDAARRRIIAQLARGPTLQAGARAVARRRSSPLRWQEFQVTPEISIDSGLAGNTVRRETLAALRVALRAQLAVLTSALASEPLRPRPRNPI
jgi:hypothetical protein